MTRLRLLAAILACFCLSPSAPARSEVIHGFAGLNPAYDWQWGLINDESFDFSTQIVVPVETGDLAWEMDMKGLPWLHFRDCYGTIVGTPLEDLEVAPPLDGPIGGGYSNHTYVIRTTDGLYVKFRNLGWVLNGLLFLTIEYYVQTDGSPTFRPNVPVKATTWGRVKALYR